MYIPWLIIQSQKFIIPIIQIESLWNPSVCHTLVHLTSWWHRRPKKLSFHISVETKPTRKSVIDRIFRRKWTTTQKKRAAQLKLHILALRPKFLLITRNTQGLISHPTNRHTHSKVCTCNLVALNLVALSSFRSCRISTAVRCTKKKQFFFLYASTLMSVHACWFARCIKMIYFYAINHTLLHELLAERTHTHTCTQKVHHKSSTNMNT